MSYVYESQADSNDYFFIWKFENSSVVSHFHKSIELVYCLEGKTEFFIDGEKYILNKDEIYFVPSYSVHYNKCLGNNKIIPFVFAHSFFHDFEKTYKGLTFDPVLKNIEANQKILKHLDRIFETFCKYNYIYDQIPFIIRQTLINELLCEMVNNYKLKPIERKKTDDRIVEILIYINSHYKEQLTLKTLSEKWFYSPKYFSNLFNKVVGCSLSAYLNNIRIENTLVQFQELKGKKSLSIIALENGFNSISTFYRVLKGRDSLQDKQLYNR